MKKALIISGTVSILVIFQGCFGSSSENEQNKELDEYSENSSIYNNQTTESTNTCSICDKTFTGNGYEEVSDGVWKPCKESYQCYICSKSCGMKHTRQMNNLVNGIDGRVYESNVCSMCKGTGIEKNTSHLTDEYGRVCPMCDARG